MSYVYVWQFLLCDKDKPNIVLTPCMKLLGFTVRPTITVAERQS